VNMSAAGLPFSVVASGAARLLLASNESAEAAAGLGLSAGGDSSDAPRFLPGLTAPSAVAFLPLMQRRPNSAGGALWARLARPTAPTRSQR
jgi:hypothetical protein